MAKCKSSIVGHILGVQHNITTATALLFILPLTSETLFLLSLFVLHFIYFIFFYFILPLYSKGVRLSLHVYITSS